MNNNNVNGIIWYKVACSQNAHNIHWHNDVFRRSTISCCEQKLFQEFICENKFSKISELLQGANLCLVQYFLRLKIIYWNIYFAWSVSNLMFPTCRSQGTLCSTCSILERLRLVKKTGLFTHRRLNQPR